MEVSTESIDRQQDEADTQDQPLGFYVYLKLLRVWNLLQIKNARSESHPNNS
jgi:hypothetical protein